MSGLIRITLEKGVIATPENHKKTVKALGLTHRHQSRILKDTPSVRGMIQNVVYLLKVEPVNSAEEKAPVTALHSVPEYALGEVKAKVKKEKKTDKLESSKSKEKNTTSKNRSSTIKEKSTAKKKMTTKVKK